MPGRMVGVKRRQDIEGGMRLGDVGRLRFLPEVG